MMFFYLWVLELIVTIVGLAVLSRALRAVTPSPCPVTASRSNTTVRLS